MTTGDHAAMMIKRLLSLGAALAALVGCGGDGPSTVPGLRSPATWSSFVYATTEGPLLLEVQGNPFGTGKAELGESISRALAAGLPGRPFSLTTDPATAPRPNFRVVVVLGAAKSLDERAICAGKVRVADGKLDGDRLDVLATFCDGESPLSSVRGWVAKLDGFQDRRLTLLFNQVVRDLMGDAG